MGSSQRGRSSVRRRSHDDAFLDRLERGRPCQSPPRYRYRVVLVSDAEGAVRRGNAPRIVWVTNELEYARSLIAQINSLAGRERARVEVWNPAENVGQSRWIRMNAAMCVTATDFPIADRPAL